MGHAVRANRTLRLLDIAFNRIGTEGTRLVPHHSPRRRPPAHDPRPCPTALCACLRARTCARARAITRARTHAAPARHALRRCGGAAVVLFAPALRVSSSLLSLVLNGNPIGYVGGREVLRCTLTPSVLGSTLTSLAAELALAPAACVRARVRICEYARGVGSARPVRSGRAARAGAGAAGGDGGGADECVQRELRRLQVRRRTGAVAMLVLRCNAANPAGLQRGMLVAAQPARCNIVHTVAT